MCNKLKITLQIVDHSIKIHFGDSISWLHNEKYIFLPSFSPKKGGKNKEIHVDPLK